MNQQAQLGWTYLPDPRIINRWGDEFENMGMLTRATETYEWGLRIDPENYRILRNLGYRYREEGRTAEAIPCYQKALAILEGRKDKYEADVYEEIRTELVDKINNLQAADE